MLSLYHEVTTRGACTLKKELQVKQCCAVNCGVLRTLHSTTGARFEHPLRYLEEPSFMVLFQAAAIQGQSTLYKASMNPDTTPIVAKFDQSQGSSDDGLRSRLPPNHSRQATGGELLP